MHTAATPATVSIATVGELIASTTVNSTGASSTLAVCTAVIVANTRGTASAARPSGHAARICVAIGGRVSPVIRAATANSTVQCRCAAIAMTT